MVSAVALLLSVLSGAAAFQMSGAWRPDRRPAAPRKRPILYAMALGLANAARSLAGLPRAAMRSASAVATPQMLLDRRSVGNVAAASLTLALSIANPNFVSAAVNPPAVVHGH